MEHKYEKVNIDAQVPALIYYFSKETMKSTDYLLRSPYIPGHWHRSIELSLVENGSISLLINEEEQRIQTGEFMLINSGFVHEMHAENIEDSRVMMVILSYDFLKKIYPDIENVCFDIHKSEKSKQRLLEIYEELKQRTLHPQPNDYLKINALLYEIVYILVTYDVVDDIEMRNRYKHIHTRQRHVLDYIEEHYHEDLSLETMSKQFHMSMEHFSRTFYKDFHVHFKTYLNNYRIYKAYPDVVKSNHTIQQIALTHGFSNVKSFITQFKEAYEMTPLQYRKHISSVKEE